MYYIHSNLFSRKVFVPDTYLRGGEIIQMYYGGFGLFQKKLIASPKMRSQIRA